MPRSPEQAELVEDFSEADLEAEQAEDMARDYAAVLKLLEADDKLKAAWDQVAVHQGARRHAERMLKLKLAEVEELKRECSRWKKRAQEVKP